MARGKAMAADVKARAVALALEGKNADDIWRELGPIADSPKHLASIICHWRKRDGLPIPPQPHAKMAYGPRHRFAAVEIAPAAWPSLEEEAQARGITAPQLLARLVDVIVRENLFTAILDDEADDAIA